MVVIDMNGDRNEIDRIVRNTVQGAPSREEAERLLTQYEYRPPVARIIVQERADCFGILFLLPENRPISVLCQRVARNTNPRTAEERRERSRLICGND